MSLILSVSSSAHMLVCRGSLHSDGWSQLRHLVVASGSDQNGLRSPLRPTPLSLPGILLSLVSKDLLDKEIGGGGRE